jgi:hypothetical protein
MTIEQKKRIGAISEGGTMCVRPRYYSKGMKFRLCCATGKLIILFRGRVHTYVWSAASVENLSTEQFSPKWTVIILGRILEE